MVQTNFIGVGRGNRVSGPYSSILGGSGCNDNGFNYAGLYGQNVNAVANNTFHIEGLNANAIPFGGGGIPGLPAGTVYWDFDTVNIPGAKLLYIV